jgi:hypothetical protein
MLMQCTQHAVSPQLSLLIPCRACRRRCHPRSPRQYARRRRRVAHECAHEDRFIHIQRRVPPACLQCAVAAYASALIASCARKVNGSSSSAHLWESKWPRPGATCSPAARRAAPAPRRRPPASGAATRVSTHLGRTAVAAPADTAAYLRAAHETTRQAHCRRVTCAAARWRHGTHQRLRPKMVSLYPAPWMWKGTPLPGPARPKDSATAALAGMNGGCT